MNVRWHSFKASANGAQIGSFCDGSRTAEENFLVKCNHSGAIHEQRSDMIIAPHPFPLHTARP